MSGKDAAKMVKKCHFCKKLIHVMTNSNRSPSESSLKKKVVGVRFKGSPFITNRQPFSNNILLMKPVCKNCKTKSKTHKPLDYLVQALASTISEGYDIENDDEIYKPIPELDKVVTIDEENAHNVMTVKETQFWSGAFQKIDNIDIQQGILKELFDSSPHDIVHQPELLRQFFENVPEQLAERQLLMQDQDENIAEIIADQQRLLRRIEERAQRRREGDVPQRPAEQQELGAGDIYRPEQIEELERPEDDEPLAIQPRVDNADPPDINEIQRRPLACYVYLPEMNNQELEQIMYHHGLFQEAADNVSKPLSIHLDGTVPYGNGKLPYSLALYQNMPPEDDDTIHDLLIVHRTLLQDDDIEDCDGTSQDTTIDQQKYLQDDNRDILELLNVLKGLNLNNSNEPPISVKHQLSSEADNSSSDIEIPQEGKHNVKKQYIATKIILSDVKGNLQKNIEYTEQEIRAGDDNHPENTIPQNLLAEDKNSCLDQLTVQQLLQEDDDVLFPDEKKEIKQKADEMHEQTAMQQKLLSDNSVPPHQDLLQEDKEKVQKPILDQQEILREGDNTSLQQLARPIDTGNCNKHEQKEHKQYISENDNVSSYRLIVYQEALQKDANKVKETICLLPKPGLPAEHQEIRADDENMSLDQLATQKTPLQKGDDNIHEQIKDYKNCMRHEHHNTPKFELLFDNGNKDRKRGLETLSRGGAQNAPNETNVETVDKPSTCLGKRVRSSERKHCKIRKILLEDSITTRRGE